MKTSVNLMLFSPPLPTIFFSSNGSRVGSSSSSIFSNKQHPPLLIMFSTSLMKALGPSLMFRDLNVAALVGPESYFFLIQFTA